MKHEFIMPFICKWEGGLSNDKNDAAASKPCPVPYKGVGGYHTNMGITWPVWQRYCRAKGITDEKLQALKFYAMTAADQSDVFKVLYWDSVYGDSYNSQAIANCMASWAWGSGTNGALTQIKKFCSNKGWRVPNSWNEVPSILNEKIPAVLFNELCEARKEFFISISPAGSKNAKFQKGWLNRLQAFRKFNEPLLK